MPKRAGPKRAGWRVCTKAGCPQFTQGGRCDEHRAEADAKRGTARQRGYGRQHEQRFRPGVLTKDPICTCPGCNNCDQPGQHCTRPSIHADHWPLSRRELTAQGLDPDDPKHGRGLCQRCHATSTSAEQPGGFLLH